MADEANANDARKAGATEVARLTRRDMLRGGLALAASIGIPSIGLSIARAAGNPASQADHSGDTHMSTITVKDGTTIYYKDWGKGPVVTLSHGWPLNSDMWDGQMLYLAQHGFRVVAHDRRGHGRSSQAWSGNDMDGYADDLAAVIETLDLKDITPQFYGANRPGAQVSQGTLDQFWLWSMQAGLKNAYDSIKAFSETDFTEDLKKFDIPTLVMHGEDDQIVPVKDSGKKSARLITGAVEIYYPGLSHGLTATHPDLINRDLLAFIREGKRKVAESRINR